MNVGDIMNRDVKTVGPDDTFAQAAKVLRENRISSVVVSGEDAPAGIVTERDFVGLIADGLDPASTTISDRMTRELVTVDSRTDIADAARLMGERRIRHLPVVDRGTVAGIISMRDLVSWAAQEMTGGHELADIERSSAALTAAVELERPH